MKTRIKQVKITIAPGTFTYIFKRIKGQNQEYEFSELSNLRKVLSNEKARILYTTKHRKPQSLYSLAKMLDRDFKSVRDDVKMLEKFGFISLQKEEKGKRKKLKPVLNVDSLNISFSI
jgi:predicted transcriptional regulator